MRWAGFLTAVVLLRTARGWCGWVRLLTWWWFVIVAPSSVDCRFVGLLRHVGHVGRGGRMVLSSGAVVIMKVTTTGSSSCLVGMEPVAVTAVTVPSSTN
jgi:hypothetical protein